MKSKSKQTFILPIYGTKVMLFKNAKDFEKEVEYTLTGEESGCSSGSVLWINPDYITVNVVAHESYHLTRRILEHVEIDHAKEEETVAYLIGYLTEQVYNFYIRDNRWYDFLKTKP